MFANLVLWTATRSLLYIFPFASINLPWVGVRFFFIIVMQVRLQLYPRKRDRFFFCSVAGERTEVRYFCKEIERKQARHLLYLYWIYSGGGNTRCTTRSWLLNKMVYSLQYLTAMGCTHLYDRQTVCPRTLSQLYIVIYHVKWVKTSWTYSILVYQWMCSYIAQLGSSTIDISMSSTHMQMLRRDQKCILPFLLNEMRFSSGRNPKWEVSEWLGEGKNKKNFWSIKERIGIIN